MNVRVSITLAGFLIVVLDVGCVQAKPLGAAEKIYSKGSILTFNDAQSSAEALAVKGGRYIYFA